MVLLPCLNPSNSIPLVLKLKKKKKERERDFKKITTQRQQQAGQSSKNFWKKFFKPNRNDTEFFTAKIILHCRFSICRSKLQDKGGRRNYIFKVLLFYIRWHILSPVKLDFMSQSNLLKKWEQKHIIKNLI